MSRWALAPFAVLMLAGPAFAVDGVIEINQAAALAGNVTPGDTPGFPVTISQSGSYRLTGNLSVSNPNSDGIEMLSSNVEITLDLNGFGDRRAHHMHGLRCDAELRSGHRPWHSGA